MHKALITPSLVVATLAITATAAAQITAGVSDEVTFAASFPSVIVEDFQDETVGALDQFFVTQFNGFTTAANGTSTFASDYELDEESFGSTNIELDLFLDSDPAFIGSFTFEFDTPQTDFGLRIDDVDASGDTSIFVGGEEFVLANLLPGTDDEAFFTFSSPTPVSEFTIGIESSVTTTDVIDGLSIDNVTIGVIPEPASLGLLAVGGLGLLRRRR